MLQPVVRAPLPTRLPNSSPEKFICSHWKPTFPLTAQTVARLGSRKSSGALEAAGKRRVRNHTQRLLLLEQPTCGAQQLPMEGKWDEQGELRLDLGLGVYGRGFLLGNREF